MAETGLLIIDEAQERTAKIAEGRTVSFTGDPWLDGVIWARAIPINNSTVGMYLTNLPAPFTEAVLDAAAAAGLACEFEEKKEHEDGVIPIRLLLHADGPIFKGLSHSKGDRWVSTSFGIEFLTGYLQAIMHNATNGLSLRPSPNLHNDVTAVLDFLGIPYWVPVNRNIGEIHIKSTKLVDANGIIPGFMALVRLEDERIEAMEAAMSQDEWNSEMEIETMAMLRNREVRLQARPLKDLMEEQLIALIGDDSPRTRTKRKAALRELEQRGARHRADDLALLVLMRKVRKRLVDDILHVLFMWGCRDALMAIEAGNIDLITQIDCRSYIERL